MSPSKPASAASRPPNPYVVAIFTAVLAGLFSVAGGYFTAGFQAKHAIAQKQYEYRVGAYRAFLDKTEHKNSPSISQLLSIGAMADHMSTDGEIQAFEDRVASLLGEYGAQDLYSQLNSDLNILRLNGSERVVEICDDILKALLLRDEEIDWGRYPSDVVEVHSRWKIHKDQGASYGWEERVSAEERLMIVSIAKLSQALVEQLRSEVKAISA